MTYSPAAFLSPELRDGVLPRLRVEPRVPQAVLRVNRVKEHLGAVGDEQRCCAQ